MPKEKSAVQRWSKAVKVGFVRDETKVGEDGLPKWMPDNCLKEPEAMQRFLDNFEDHGWIMHMVLQEMNQKMIIFRRKEAGE